MAEEAEEAKETAEVAEEAGSAPGFRGSEVLRGMALATLAVGLLTVGERFATLLTQETPWQRLLVGLVLLVALLLGRIAGRYLPARPDDSLRFTAACALALLLPAVWWAAAPLLPRLAARLPPLASHEQILAWLAVVDLLLIAPTAFAIGLCRQERATNGRGAGLGTFLGFVLALPLTNLLIDQIGSPNTLATIVFLASMLRLAARPRRPALPALGAALAVLSGLLMPADLLARELERRFGPLLAFHESSRDLLFVTDEPDRGRMLRGADGRPRAAAALRSDDRLAVHLPALLHGSPRRALLLGVGSGHGIEAATRHPELRIDVAKEAAGVLAMRRFFTREPTRAFHTVEWPSAQDEGAVAAADLILAAAPSPTAPAFDRLFAAENLAHLDKWLAPGGLFVTSLDLTQLSDDELHTVLEVIESVWPEVTIWTTGSTWLWLVIASHEPQQIDLLRWRGQATAPELHEELRAAGMPTPLHLLAGYVGDARAVRAALPGEAATPGRTAWRVGASPDSFFGFSGANADARLGAILGAEGVSRAAFGRLFDRMRLTESLRGDVTERVQPAEDGLSPDELRAILRLLRKPQPRATRELD